MVVVDRSHYKVVEALMAIRKNWNQHETGNSSSSPLDVEKEMVSVYFQTKSDFEMACKERKAMFFRGGWT